MPLEPLHPLLLEPLHQLLLELIVERPLEIGGPPRLLDQLPVEHFVLLERPGYWRADSRLQPLGQLVRQLVGQLVEQLVGQLFGQPLEIDGLHLQLLEHFVLLERLERPGYLQAGSQLQPAGQLVGQPVGQPVGQLLEIDAQPQLLDLQLRQHRVLLERFEQIELLRRLEH